jgi:hypothetical protein
MSTIVALFTDDAAAARAAARVVDSGVAPSAVHLHRQGQPPRNAAGVVVDEYASGGFFTNFLSLLDGLLQTRREPQVAASYADVVRHEGVAVSVDCSSESAARSEALLRDAGAVNVARSPA